MIMSLMRETAINLVSICEELGFGGSIETKAYYEDKEEYCLVVFNEKKFKNRGKEFMDTA